MASNMYIKIDKVKGESEDEKHKEWIEILSWSHGFSQPASPVRTSTGSTLERANHSDISITKYIDSATKELLKACWSGLQFEKADIECFRADGDNEPIKYLMITLEDIIVSNYSLSGGGGGIPVENISLAYAKVTYTYNPKKKADATAAGPMVISHNLAFNTVE